MPCQTPHLDENTTAAPGISPSTVVDEENLIREVLNPDHFVNGQVVSAAIPLSDLQERGFSVHRLEYVTRKFVENAINQKLARPYQDMPRASEGVARFSARAVREFRDNGNQAFVVVDAATISNPGHASIYLSKVGMKGSQARSMRNKLLPLLEYRMSVAAAFAVR